MKNPMAKDEDDDRRNNTCSMHADFDTQPFDYTSSPSCGEEDQEGEYFEDTVPFDDGGDGDDMLEAQIAGDTQVVEIAGETQVLDDDGETQALDDGDDDDDDETQVLDGESESDQTQVLEDVDDEVAVVDDPHSADSKEVLDESSCGHRMSKQNISGSLPPRFTLLRAKSLREAALANRKVALKAQDETNPVIGMRQFSQEPPVVKGNGECFPGRSEKVREVDEEFTHGKYNVETEGFENKNKCEVGFSAVRKLFNDDVALETNGTSLNSTDCNEGDGLDKLLIDHGDTERLSYLNSQEPGDLSQANALDFVDKFLKDNITEFDQEPNGVKNVVEKSSKSLPSTKGKQSLAKRVTDRNKDKKAGIYDWDDNCEDEGGGDIFLRRKEDFFNGGTHGPRSMPGLQKTKLRRPIDDKDEEEQLSIPNKRKTAVHSDSRLGMHNLKIRHNAVQEAMRKLKRNLVDELDEQVNADCSRVEVEANANAGAQEILDVGLDTQIAAEAMEALCNAGDIVDHASNVTTRVTRSKLTDPLSDSSTRKVGQCNKDYMMSRSKKRKLNAEGNRTSSANVNGRIVSSPIVEERKSERSLKRHHLNKLNNSDDNNGGNGGNKQLQAELYHFTPVARRTRRSLAVNPSTNCDVPSKSLGKGKVGVGSLEKSSGTGLQASKTLDPKSTPGSSDLFKVDDNAKLCQLEKSAPKTNALSLSNNVEIDTLDFPRRRRSLRINKFSSHDKGSETLVGSSKPSPAEDVVRSTSGKRKMRNDSVVKSHVNRRTRSSSYGGSVISSTDRKQRNNSTDNFEVASSDGSPRDRYKSPDFTTASPANCKTPANDASPICMGDDYYNQSCNTSASKSCLLKVSRKELQRELRSLNAIRPELVTPSKDSRKRKDMTDVRILFSHHLDEDIIKHQKKVLARLGVSVVSSISDATHFIADQFVRTRNMLEAIAFGKPVVTHSWIESCGQASCFLDERNYILRDAKKEKEFGFSLPVSLARASEHPLLKGRRVLITPSTKPSKDIISRLVMAVQGQAVERVGRSAMKDHKIPDDLLILSCEEDYASCVPFLEKGAVIYSSELLLNGIVTQKLEYQRYRLFADHVKKTRTTIWLRRDDRTFVPVTKCA